MKVLSIEKVRKHIGKKPKGIKYRRKFDKNNKINTN